MAIVRSMKPFALALVLALLMVGTALVPSAVGPAAHASRAEPTFVLEQLVPFSFAGWRVLPSGGAQVVNPQAKEMLDKIYSQLLTRMYVSEDGYVVMLSIAYGNEHRGDLKVHLPDVCYPAQGFTITNNRRSVIAARGKRIDVVQMEAQLGGRVEPITYWVRQGDANIAGMNMVTRRIEDLRFALRGVVPDGLLLRVSSIDGQQARAFKRQEQFISDLMAAVGPSGQLILAGGRH